ncbi:unnamed protein product [Brassica rapa subsp. narinosa]
MRRMVHHTLGSNVVSVQLKQSQPFKLSDMDFVFPYPFNPK